MKLSGFLLSALILFSIVSCTSFKTGLIQTGGGKEAIQNAILDFSNTSALYEKDTIFSVSLVEIPNERFLVVRIIKNNMKLLFSPETKVGSKSHLPSRYVEKEGKLFIWWDENYALTKDALTVFRQYGLLQDDEGGIITFPDFIIDDTQKAAHYYFCKNNLTSYKKVVTNKGIGYYPPPKLDCSF